MWLTSADVLPSFDGGSVHAVAGKAASPCGASTTAIRDPAVARACAGMGAARPPAAARREVRVGVVAVLALLVWLSTALTSRQQWAANRRAAARRAQEVATDGDATAGSGGALKRDGGGGGARPKFGLPQPDLEAAVVLGSERYGQVVKAGHVPQEFWTDARRPWREGVFTDMLKRGACCH